MRRSSDGAVLTVLFLLLAAPSCAEPEANGKEDGGTDGKVARAAGDYWLGRFEGYMTPQFRQAYLETPEDERFRVHGDALLGFLEREDLLEREGEALTPEEKDEYRRLPDLEASRAYLRERAPPAEE
jgi:hypothetical protein